MLLLDNRAGSVDLLPYFPPEMAQLRRLDAGDVAFLGNGPDGSLTLPIGIEYKTASEALQCMISGRLVAEQLPKMSQIYKRVYILIEGEYSERNDGMLQFRKWTGGKPSWVTYSQVTYRAFDNFLNSLAEMARVTIKRSVDRRESAAQVMNLYHMWTKDYAQHNSIFTFDRSREPALLYKPAPERVMIAKIPGVGWQLSARVAEHFSNDLESVVTAGVKEWQAINGIGKIKAEKIVRFLQKKKHSQTQSCTTP